MKVKDRKQGTVDIVQVDEYKTMVGQLRAATHGVNLDVIVAMGIPNLSLDMSKVLEYYSKKECDLLMSLQKKANFKPDKNQVFLFIA